MIRIERPQSLSDSPFQAWFWEVEEEESWKEEQMEEEEEDGEINGNENLSGKTYFSERKMKNRQHK